MAKKTYDGLTAEEIRKYIKYREQDEESAKQRQKEHAKEEKFAENLQKEVEAIFKKHKRCITSMGTDFLGLLDKFIRREKDPQAKEILRQARKEFKKALDKLKKKR